MIARYLELITDQVFKILPVREEHECELSVWQEYIDSLLVQLKGSFIVHPVLKKEPEYIAVVSIVAYLSHNELSVDEVRREVFKMCRMLNQLEKRYRNKGRCRGAKNG